MSRITTHHALTTRPIHSIPQAADLLGIGSSTAYRWASAGELPTITLNGRRWVTSAALCKLLGLPHAGVEG